jgi:hypothetical protein
VRIWVKQADIDEGHAPGVSTTEAARIKDLEQENRKLRRANEILKRAASFLGRSSTANTRSVAFIDASRHEIVEGRKLGVEPICAILRNAGVQVAASTYYAAKNRPASARGRSRRRHFARAKE